MTIDLLFCILNEFRSKLINIIVVNAGKVSDFFNGSAIKFEDLFNSFLELFGVFANFSLVVFNAL